MCLSKFFKKEDYEKINEMGEMFIQKLYSERGRYWFKIVFWRLKELKRRVV